MLDDCCYAVIMAGGAGTRLWPLSTKNKPKHLLRIFNGKSLIELTTDKLKSLIPDDRILVLTSINYKQLTQQTLPNIPPDNFICEPCIRDTASAIALAATVLKQRCEDPTMIMLTADQIIEPADRFNTAIANAADFLDSHPDNLIAFGVEAVSANTLVGWQKLGDTLDFTDCQVRKIDQFTEKPDQDTAKSYMQSQNYCWNSGQFAWKANAIIKEITTHLPQAAPLLEQIGTAWNTTARVEVLNELFPQMPTGSIDYKIMQKTDNACSIFLPCSWLDMGTHAALADKIGTEQDGNAVFGKAIVAGTANNVLNTTDQSVVVAGDNLTIVVTDKTIFIGDSNTDMKALAQDISQKDPELQ